MQQPHGLIEVLLDVMASEADRDDAAMDLAAYDEPEVEEALIRMGADPSTQTQWQPHAARHLLRFGFAKRR